MLMNASTARGSAKTVLPHIYVGTRQHSFPDGSLPSAVLFSTCCCYCYHCALRCSVASLFYCIWMCGRLMYAAARCKLHLLQQTKLVAHTPRHPHTWHLCEVKKNHMCILSNGAGAHFCQFVHSTRWQSVCVYIIFTNLLSWYTNCMLTLAQHFSACLAGKCRADNAPNPAVSPPTEHL